MVRYSFKTVPENAGRDAPPTPALKYTLGRARASLSLIEKAGWRNMFKDSEI
jgi:hypothetical protein